VELEFINGILETVVKNLRQMQPALIARRQDDKMLINVRTLMPEDDDLIVRLMLELIDNESNPGGLL